MRVSIDPGLRRFLCCRGPGFRHPLGLRYPPYRPLDRLHHLPGRFPRPARHRWPLRRFPCRFRLRRFPRLARLRLHADPVPPGRLPGPVVSFSDRTAPVPVRFR